MPVLVVGQVLLHVHYLAGRSIHRLVVAGKAQVYGFFKKHLWIVGTMGIVAVKAFFLGLGDGPMFGLYAFHMRFLARMAHEAEVFVAVQFQVVLVTGAVGAMAVHASKLYGRMDVFIIFQLFRLVRMAGQAEVISFGKKHVVIRRAVRVMAYGALAGCCRSMLERASHHLFVMAHEAEFLSFGLP